MRTTAKLARKWRLCARETLIITVIDYIAPFARPRMRLISKTLETCKRKVIFTINEWYQHISLCLRIHQLKSWQWAVTKQNYFFVLTILNRTIEKTTCLQKIRNKNGRSRTTIVLLLTLLLTFPSNTTALTRVGQLSLLGSLIARVLRSFRGASVTANQTNRQMNRHRTCTVKWNRCKILSGPLIPLLGLGWVFVIAITIRCLKQCTLHNTWPVLQWKCR